MDNSPLIKFEALDFFNSSKILINAHDPFLKKSFLRKILEFSDSRFETINHDNRNRELCELVMADRNTVHRG